MSVSSRHKRAPEKIFGDVRVECWHGERYIASVEGTIRIGRTHMPLAAVGVSSGEAVKKLFDQVALAAQSPGKYARGETRGPKVLTQDERAVIYSPRGAGLALGGK